MFDKNRMAEIEEKLSEAMNEIVNDGVSVDLPVPQVLNRTEGELAKIVGPTLATWLSGVRVDAELESILIDDGGGECPAEYGRKGYVRIYHNAPGGKFTYLLDHEVELGDEDSYTVYCPALLGTA